MKLSYEEVEVVSHGRAKPIFILLYGVKRRPNFAQKSSFTATHHQSLPLPLVALYCTVADCASQQRMSDPTKTRNTHSSSLFPTPQSHNFIFVIFSSTSSIRRAIDSKVTHSLTESQSLNKKTSKWEWEEFFVSVCHLA